MIITIDGPAGSGKSSVARELAKKLRFIHLNSGLLYRAVGYVAKSKSVALDESLQLKIIVDGLKFDFILNVVDFRTDIQVHYVPDNKILDPKELLLDEWSQDASQVGTLSYVREVMTRAQREIGVKNNLVLEGRDSGSVVFPNADYKFYLNAPLEERVKRRLAQEYGDNVSMTSQIGEKFLAEISKRDERDSSRSIAPQVVPEDAEVIETEKLSLQEVVDVLYKKIRPKESEVI